MAPSYAWPSAASFAGPQLIISKERQAFGLMAQRPAWAAAGSPPRFPRLSAQPAGGGPLPPQHRRLLQAQAPCLPRATVPFCVFLAPGRPRLGLHTTSVCKPAPSRPGPRTGTVYLCILDSWHIAGTKSTVNKCVNDGHSSPLPPAPGNGLQTFREAGGWPDAPERETMTGV